MSNVEISVLFYLSYGSGPKIETELLKIASSISIRDDDVIKITFQLKKGNKYFKTLEMFH